MNLVSIYSSLQYLPKDVMEIVWSYLRPDAQRKMSMTCVRFHSMFKSDKNLSIPDLNSLPAKSMSKKSANHNKWEYDRKIKNWEYWINESKEIENNLLRWRWSRNLTSVEIIFMKIEVGYLISTIRVQYNISKYRDYSFAEFDIKPGNKMSRYYTLNNVHGPKFKNMPPESLIYQQLASTIKLWIRDNRIRHLLNPICEHALRGRNPSPLSFRIQVDVHGFSLKCNNCLTEEEYE